MNSLRIKPSKSQASPGDFAAQVTDSNLLLPESVASALASHGVATAVDLVSYVQAFPSAVAADLKWSIPELTQAIARLNAQLVGHVDERILNPPRRPKPGYGALNPALRQNSR